MSIAEEKSVEITSISKEKGGFIITLTNTGDTLVRGIFLNISINGGWINPIDFYYDELLFSCNCTDVFQPGNTYIISTLDNETFFSFGLLVVSVKVSSEAIGTIKAKIQAFIIGSFIILL
jgi:hypothetical protein